MSRAEKRAMKRNGLSDRDIRAIELENAYQKGIKDGMKQSVEIVFYMAAYSINYKLGFGAKRLQEIMYAIYNNIDAFRTNHLDSADYVEIKRQMNKLGIYIK